MGQSHSNGVVKRWSLVDLFGPEVDGHAAEDMDGNPQLPVGLTDMTWMTCNEVRHVIARVTSGAVLPSSSSTSPIPDYHILRVVDVPTTAGERVVSSAQKAKPYGKRPITQQTFRWGAVGLLPNANGPPPSMGCQQHADGMAGGG